MRGQRGKRKKKDQGGLAGWNREGKEREGCQHQGGPLALNGSLVRKVEGEEAQIKDVPSLKRKSSHLSILNSCLKGRKRGRRGEKSVCSWKGEAASAIQPPGRQGGVQGCRRFPDCPDHTRPCAAWARTTCWIYRRKRPTNNIHTHIEWIQE